MGYKIDMSKTKKELDKHGAEINDPTPVEIPAGFRIPESLTTQIKRLIRNQMSIEAEAQGQETFEEANDFDVEEEDAELFATEYEEMPEEVSRGRERTAEDAPRSGRSADRDDEGSGDDVDRESAGRDDRDSEEERPRTRGRSDQTSRVREKERNKASSGVESKARKTPRQSDLEDDQED